jgi:acyl dehydratase
MSHRGPGETLPTIAPSIVGLEVGPRRADIDARWLMAYAAASALHQPASFDTTAADGPLAHPLFPVCYEWPLLVEIRASAIGDAAAPFGVHASHRLHLHRLPRAGDELSSVARITTVAARRSGTLVVARLVTRDAGGAVVSETDYGSLYRGVPVADGALAALREGLADAASPDHGGSAADAQRDDAPAPAAQGPTRLDAMASAPRWTHAVDVPYHLGHVYTECARIWNPIHTDLAVARAAGLPGPILHGTATLALAVSRIVERDLAGDSRAVRGIDARFTGMVPLPSTFTVRAGARDRHGIAFEAVDAAGARVLSQGVLRL